MDSFLDFYHKHPEPFLVLITLACGVFIFWYFRAEFRRWTGIFNHFREQRLSEGLSQRELLKKELKLLGAALLFIVGLCGFFALLVWVVS